MTRDKQKKLQAFYTPDALADKMVSKFTSLDGNFVDPTCGSDLQLLKALIRAGVKPECCYGNELDYESYIGALETAKEIGIPEENIFNMDALNDDLYKKLPEQYQVIMNPPFKFGNKILKKVLEWMPE